MISHYKVIDKSGNEIALFIDYMEAVNFSLLRKDVTIIKTPIY